MKIENAQDLELFRRYMQLTGVPSITDDPAGPGLTGKKLGIVNGSSWIILWSTYFGRTLLPGVRLINIGNEAIQLNFMRAHEQGLECPPQVNIEKLVQYARDLCELEKPDVILSTCSTMNRSLSQMKKGLAEYRVPVVQIDEPMMEKALSLGPRILVIATHGPTVNSTFSLLEETAQRMGIREPLQCKGAIVEDAFSLLGEGRIEEHNGTIAEQIRRVVKEGALDCVVLAQLSMSVFKIQYPDAHKIFGIPVLTSGEEGFLRVKEIMTGKYISSGEEV